MPATHRGKTGTSLVAPDAAAEWDTLAAELNRWGVRHLAPTQLRQGDVPLQAKELFERLWSAEEPRLQQAAVVLLLTHPELAAEAQVAIGRMSGMARDRAVRRYVAAAALQRMARTRIAMDLGPQPLLPPAYLDDLGLPPLDEEFGRTALLALAAAEQERYGYDAWGTYWTLLDHFLSAIRTPKWGKACDN